jgi:hypothetical protein
VARRTFINSSRNKRRDSGVFEEEPEYSEENFEATEPTGAQTTADARRAIERYR